MPLRPRGLVAILIGRNVLAPVAKGARHPDEFVQKIVYALDVGFIQQFAGSVEYLLDIGKIPVVEDGDEPQLSQHGQQILNHARAAEAARRDAADADRLVYVFSEVGVQRMLEQPRIAVIIFRRDDKDRIGARNGGGKLRVLDGLARIIEREIQLAHVNQLGLDIVALSYFVEDKAGDVFAHAPLSRRAENDRNKERRVGRH